MQEPWIADYINRVPPDAMIRGMFFTWVHEFCITHGLSHEKQPIIDFKLYPVRDFLNELSESIAPIAETDGFDSAARQYGRFIFPYFGKTLIGRSMLSAKLTPEAVFGIAPRAYKVLTDGAVDVSIRYAQAEVAIVRYSNLWVFNDSVGVGTWEGVLNGLGLKGNVKVLDSDKRSRATLEVSWTSA